MSVATLHELATHYVATEYPSDSLSDQIEVVNALVKNIEDGICDEKATEIQQKVAEEKAKQHVRDLSEKTRNLLLEGVLLAIILDLLVNHIYALLDAYLYGGSSIKNGIGFVMVVVVLTFACFAILSAILLWGIKDAIIEYRAIKSHTI